MSKPLLRWARYELSKEVSACLKDIVPANLDETGDSFAFDVPDLRQFSTARDKAIYLLHTAAEIEHALLVQYLYAAYSLGEPFAGGEVPGDAAAQVARWKVLLLKTAREEMGHFLTVQNLLRFLDAPLNFEREDFPFNKELYPFHFTLEPLTRRSLAKYVAAEMPAKAARSPELAEILELAKDAAGGEPVNRVGVLYALLHGLFSAPDSGIENDSEANRSWNYWTKIVKSATSEIYDSEFLHLRDEDLHPETAPHQATWEDWGAERSIIVRRVSSRTEALAALQAVAEQGEGVSSMTSDDSHFARFLTIYRQFPDETKWTPARSVPINPDLSNDAETDSAFTNPRSRGWAELLNIRYRLLLTALAHFLYNDELLFVGEGERKGDRTVGGLLHLCAFDEMRRVGKIAEKLATMPRGRDKDAARAGAPFNLPDSLVLPDDEPSRWKLHRELRRQSLEIIENLQVGDARDQTDAFLKYLVKADTEAINFAEAIIENKPAPSQSIGFAKAMKILDEAVHGFAVRGAHGSFWANQSLHQIAAKDFYKMPFLIPGDALKSGVYRALEGLAPFGSDTGTPNAVWQRMPVGRPPVDRSRREFLKNWIDSLPTTGDLPDEQGIEIEPNPSAEPLPVPVIDGGDCVVIGAGLAGLAAAVDLAAKGLRVTLLEKANQVGGKTMAWRDGKDGKGNPVKVGEGDTVEHGMHGWWHQYFNYFDLMRRVGINPDDVLFDPMPSTVIFEDGTRSTVNILRKPYATPFFLLKYLRQIGGLSFVDLMSGAVPFLKMFAFEHRRDLERYDNISTYDYFQQHGGTDALHGNFASPFARSFAFTTTDKLSAGAFISGMTFYYIGHQEDGLIRWCRGNPQELLIDRIAGFITENGGTIRTNSAVTGLEIDDEQREGEGKQRIAAVTVGESQKEFRVALAEIPIDKPLVRDFEKEVRILFRKKGNQVTALRATCTHAGGIVDFVPSLDCYVCPKHQGRYDLDGNVLEKPPTRALEKLPVRIEGDEAVVGIGGKSVCYTAKAFILAPGVEGVKRIVNASPAVLRHETFLRIMNLETTPVVIARLWLDRKTPADLVTGVFAGLGILDNFFILSNLQDEFRSYDGTVIEVQMGKVNDYIHLADAELLDLVIGEIGRLIPELTGATVRKYAFNRYWDLFTHYTPGSNQYRPGTITPYENFFFAGDWMRLDEPWWMMEKAVTSGRIAANHALKLWELPPGEIFRPRPDEFFTRACKWTGKTLSKTARLLDRLFSYRPLDP